MEEEGYIADFNGIEKPGDYFHRLRDEIQNYNEKFHAFNFIPEKLEEGFPFSVKDNICVKGVETTASSRILSGYLPPFDATVVRRVKEKGFSFIGKTNMDEFGFGSFGINTDISARNPFDEDRVAGGSSSGAAVATALIKYHIAIAESTGGSISNPASFCGVVGFTPTYGAVSRYGLIDYANSLDKIGLMARSVKDIEFVFDIMKGKDEHDSTSVDRKIENKKSRKITVIDEMISGVDEDIRKSFDSLLGKLEAQGYKISHTSLKEIGISGPVYYIISMAEASTNLAKFSGFKYGLKVEDFSLDYNTFFTNARDAFGEEAKRRIILGTFVRAASVRARYYQKALSLRALLIRKMREILKDSYILSPTMPIKAPKIKDVEKLTPVQNYMLDILTIPPNLCGFPHISFPYDYIDGLPIGAQVITDHFNDKALFSFVEDWENNFTYKFKYNLGEI